MILINNMLSKKKIEITNLRNWKFFMISLNDKSSYINEHIIGFHGNINPVIKPGRILWFVSEPKSEAFYTD